MYTPLQTNPSLAGHLKKCPHWALLSVFQSICQVKSTIEQMVDLSIWECFKGRGRVPEMFGFISLFLGLPGL